VNGISRGAGIVAEVVLNLEIVLDIKAVIVRVMNGAALIEMN